MKIVHVASTLTGGAGVGLWRYHQALVAAGLESRILVMQAPAAPDPAVAAVVWHKAPLPLRVARRCGLLPSRAARLRTELAELDRQASPGATYELFSLPFSDYRPELHPWLLGADVVNLHWVAGFVDWPRFLVRVRSPLVFTLHDQQAYLGGFHYAADAAANPHLAGLERRVLDLKRAALAGRRVAVLANSRWNATAAEASGFFPAGGPVETLYYPLDPTIYVPRPAAAARAGLPLDPRHLVVGFACENLDNPRKGFADLVAALTLLPAPLRTQVTLLSFGRPPAPELQARVNLPWHHLGFLATDAAKAAAYAAMDVFVVPSRAEAFGLTAIEAQAVGIPVIAPPLGGLREAVAYADEDYGPGPFRPEALRDHLAALLTDPARRAARGARGRSDVVVRHDPARLGRQLADFHRRAAAPVAPTP